MNLSICPFISRSFHFLIFHLNLSFCICFQLLPTALFNHTGLYLGCYGVSTDSPELFYSGLVGYAEIDEKVCIRRCSNLGYVYAAIQSGLQCFCSPSIPATQSDCLLPFTSDILYPKVPMRFYRIPRENVSVKNVSFSHNRRRLGEVFTIQAAVNNHEIGMVKFTADFGDGNELCFCASPATYFYKNPGLYRVLIVVEDLKGNRFNFSENIEITDNLTKLAFECPKAVPQGIMVHCTAKIARGLNLKGNVSVENKQSALPQIPGILFC